MKVQLHCHLEGTVREPTYRELAARAGVEPKPYRFESFLDFLRLFRHVLTLLGEPDDFRRIAREYVEDAARQGVAYAELHVSPSAWRRLHPALDVRACVEATRAGLDEAGPAHRLETALIVDLTRNFGPESAEASARQAVAMRDLGVVAIGLGGDEREWPPELFARAYAIARDGGLRGVAHAGEAAGPESVRAAIEVLGADRIGHAVRAVEDPRVVALLAERQVPVEVCPTSNRLTGAAPADRVHPIGALDAAGVVVTIDADDPALFGCDLLDEYAIVAAELGTDAVIRFAENAIEASFADPQTKARLRARFAASRNSPLAGRSS
ncbi:MAG: adenosine deaminase [Myxococcales bacterium]|nr:adenosine deaminase [Myxococcales bacterium]